MEPLEIIDSVQTQKKEIIKKIKENLNTSTIEEIINKSLNPSTSTGALSNTLLILNKIEQVLFDVSIVKMEMRELSEKLPNENQYSMVRKELKVALSAVGDCYIIAKSRYDHVDKILMGVRSINSNLRTRDRANDETTLPKE